MKDKTDPSRRDFMKGAAAAGAAFGAFTILGATAKGQSKGFKVGLIGCGGRGNGALGNHMAAAKHVGLESKVVATCDYFKGKAEGTGGRYGVPKEKCFGGANGYKQLLDTDVEVVLMATSPNFRPVHYEACIEAGKHVFMEKPVAIDPPGCRMVIEAGEAAKKKGLLVVAGTQRRHEQGYNRRAAMVKEGAHGRVLAGRVSWCSGGGGGRPIGGEMTADRLISSWYVWVQMSGDHVVEQHVHNLDIGNWFMGSHPVACVAFGGRARRRAGNIYDFFSADLEYPGGLHLHAMCRQVQGCWGWVGESFVYEKQPPRDFKLQNPVPYSEIPQHGGGHQQEHINMLYYLVKGKPLNEARNVAEATAVAVMGRISAYTGQMVSWRDMMENPKGKSYNLTLKPTAKDFETGDFPMPKELPDRSALAVPGKG
jgi:predicted dehydrogenase